MGTVSEGRFTNGSPEKTALHALTGGIVTEAMGGDFRTGALAAGANEALVDHLAELVNNNPGLLVAASQIVGVIAAEMTKGDISPGAEIAAQATRYNYLSHDQLSTAQAELAACEGDNSCMADVVERYQAISQEQNEAAYEACSTDLAACQEQSLAAAEGEYARYGDDALWDLPNEALPYMQALFDENIGVQNQFGEATIARLLTEGGISPEMAAVLAAMPVGYNKSTPPKSVDINARAALRAKLSGLEKAQRTAAEVRTLPDGRVRYYTAEVSARTEGPTRGASFVTEHSPETGQVRQWMESYDHVGNVVRVHPKSLNGMTLDSQHYPPTGREVGE